jgi:hypothetical protein
VANEITLTPGASAEPNTCGSCKFFERKNYDERRGVYGFCRIELPKKIATQWNIRAIDPKMKDAEYTGNEDQIKDTDRCDLQRPDGKVYIVQRRIPPEKVD